MKKFYNEPLVEAVMLEADDVIRTSGENGDCYLDDKFEPQI